MNLPELLSPHGKKCKDCETRDKTQGWILLIISTVMLLGYGISIVWNASSLQHTIEIEDQCNAKISAVNAQINAYNKCLAQTKLNETIHGVLDLNLTPQEAH
jgi:hypothetical protein